MKNNSYVAEIAATKLVLSGLKSNTERLGKRGIDAAFLTKLIGHLQPSIDPRQ